MKFNYLILSWFDKNKRELPWRNTLNPFHIWLSEIILQQTRVEQGKNFYLNFITEFDTVKDLANADEQKVLKLWQGLGYYSRARNLHFTAQFVSNELNGVFPDSFKELKKLKGIGDYTAAAIASIVYKEPVPAVDGNMFRVFSRYFNVEDDISLAKTKKVFWDLGLEVIDEKRPGDFNQAVMDLGATICLPKAPKCEICPINESCEALRLNKVLDLPIKTKKTKVTNRFLHFILVENEGKIGLVKREGNDVWRNLFTLPMIETTTDLLDNELLIKENIHLDLGFISEEKHILSHQNLFIKYYRYTADVSKIEQLRNVSDFEWINLNDIENCPLPKPIEKFINYHFLD
ncbi:A/G-specific adenine glycosylase [Faecalibacter macacae]|uniref:Adenine DNA glycosylase n=1 Tax=Faecalibacter macacae TaxID=1859289 RepID=A0A3L9MBQ3_9FLAO|nr:A/G-specific adenine glycosylase [Faecalibacter macacae]RLZ10490.1 A/G-specific adenine glycosylase [Faecalibacter macacae]